MKTQREWFFELFKNDIPLIDVRAPIEFRDGHFPKSVNLPLMNDLERERVGTCYKEKGQAAALALGHSLVNGKTREARIQAWCKFIQAQSSALLYCFRGGLRSQISQEWIAEANLKIEFVPGGFKALRRFLLTELEHQLQQRTVVLLAGKTGAGKTPFLHQQPLPFLDLEKRAHHRGSSFGLNGIQPAQVTFENQVIIDLLKLEHDRPTLIEHESATIGKITIPTPLFSRMREAKMVILERPLDERADHIIDEYVLTPIHANGGNLEKTRMTLAEGLQRISKKLGGLRYQELKKTLDLVFQSSEVHSFAAHREWVIPLIEHYYDPPYLRDIDRKKAQIIFQGNEAACRDYLNTLKNQM